MKLLLCTCVLAILCQHGLLAGRVSEQLRVFGNSQANNGQQRVMMEEVQSNLRYRRTAPLPSVGPIIHGNFSFGDNNPYALIDYLSSNSPVILVLTYSYVNNDQQQRSPTNIHLYRSGDYGASFTSIVGTLDREEHNPSLWNDLFVSPIHNSNRMIVVYHATKPKFYFSLDEGANWVTQNLSPSTINPRSLLWNSVNDNMALAHDSVGNQLYVTQDRGISWNKIADYVEFPTDYQWGDPSFDSDPTRVYFNTYNPIDHGRLEYRVSLYTQHSPYNSNTLREFDPRLGLHDAFLLLGPYIFAQKADSQNIISLYISYQRQPFQKAMIPSTDAHRRYAVSHIDLQQALVIVEHASGQFNLYLSDITGVYFSLSLPDIVSEDSSFDLELIEGVNGTLVANQYVRSDPTQASNTMRTLISLDNGGNWELVRPPSSAQCSPPQCSLHFHMTTSAYARTGVYSQSSAPGLILAHGTTGRALNANNPDLYISRDGGVTWALTLRGSWGVSVLDHGGLLVAARDYHQDPSTELRYSCSEGMSWNSFNFSRVGMVVYGVVTEPGEHTTTVSLYGLKRGTNTWDVVTVNFSSIFQFTCSLSDYYDWRPWDDRTDQGCILGSTVVIERRNASICCLIGESYLRRTQFSVCPCFEDDFECDYGYQHTDGFTGPCIRDMSIKLSDPCIENHTIYKKTQGYRKIAGDVCMGGEEAKFGAGDALCCENGMEQDQSNKNHTAHGVEVVLGVLLALVGLIVIILGVLTFYHLRKISQLRQQQLRDIAGSSTRLHFHNDSSRQPLVSTATDDDDDVDPLPL